MIRWIMDIIELAKIAQSSSLLQNTNTIVNLNRVYSSILRLYVSPEKKFLCVTSYSHMFNLMSHLKKSKIETR